MRQTRLIICIGFVFAMVSVSIAGTPLGTGFTYQGQIKQSGLPFTGSASMTFSLYDAGVGGDFLGTQMLSGVSINGGLFTVILNDSGQFGPSAFNGDRRWLEISINGTPLLPRQELTAGPYALFAPASGGGGGLTLPYSGIANIANNTVLSIFNTAITGNSFGIAGSSSSPTGIGVYGNALATSGPAAGVQGFSASSTGFGVYGGASSTTGLCYGLYGVTNSAESIAVRGYNSGTIGDAYGGSFQTDSTNGVAVRGYAFATAGTTYGGSFSAASSGGIGVHASGGSTGVDAVASGLDATAVKGHATASSGFNRAVVGICDSSDHGATGVFGVSTANTGQTYAIQGRCQNSECWAGYFEGWGTFQGVAIASEDRSGGQLHVGWGPLWTANSWRKAVSIPDAAAIEFGQGATSTRWGIGASAGGLYVFTSPDDGAANPATYRLFINNSGDVGVGTTTPGEKLHVAGNIRASGNVFASCGILSCSDARFKTVVEPLCDAMSMIRKLRPVRFDWRRNEFPDRHFGSGTQVGLIAQELQQVAPELIGKDSEGYLAVDYARLTPILIRAVQEQQRTIDDQQSMIDHQHKQMASWRAEKDAEIADLKARLERVESIVSRLAYSRQEPPVTRTFRQPRLPRHVSKFSNY